MEQILLKVENLNIEFHDHDVPERVVNQLNMVLHQGEILGIVGESGSGKTTLLNILAALDRPTGGQVLLDGKSMSKVREKEMTAFRRNNLGFVFQDFNLLDTFSLQDNIFLPLVLGGKDYKEMKRRLLRESEPSMLKHLCHIILRRNYIGRV